MAEQRPPFSKKDQRQISAFTAQEFLYDYLCRKLDPERMKAVDELVARNREIQDEIHSLNQALSYAEHLGDLAVSTALIEQIKAPTSYLQGLLQKVRFGHWPMGLKLGLEVLLVSFLLFSAIIVIPWNRVLSFRWSSGGDVTLVEVQQEFKKRTDVNVPDGNSASVTSPSPSSALYQDDAEIKKVATASATPATQSPPTGNATPLAVPVEKLKKTEAPAEEVKSPISQGYLYRGAIAVANLPATTEKFVEKISSLGGRKAGEVELGWKKGQGTYFHFTIPQAKLDGLVEYLNGYGTLKVAKEKHDRVMPDGIVRLIITVSEDKKAKQ